MIDIVSGKDLLVIINERQISSFTAFYSSFFQKLIVTSEKYVQDIYAAEEIVQNVFLKIWETPEDLQDVKTLKPYLNRAVVNASISYLNRQKNIEQHHLKIAAKLTDEHLNELDEENELIVLLYREIEKLPPQCKKVFKLNRFDQLKYREIADQLNLSERTVENHIANALKILRAAMLNNRHIAKDEHTHNLLMTFFLF